MARELRAQKEAALQAVEAKKEEAAVLRFDIRELKARLAKEQQRASVLQLRLDRAAEELRHHRSQQAQGVPSYQTVREMFDSADAVSRLPRPAPPAHAHDRRAGKRCPPSAPRTSSSAAPRWLRHPFHCSLC
eukprot:COSAG01_NODE_22581_length_849_cov_42.965333_1_plen_131_part_10